MSFLKHNLFVLTLLFLGCGCGTPSRTQNSEAGAVAPSKPLEMRPISTLSIQTFQMPGIEIFYALGVRVYAGSQPEGDESFAALARLGIQTVISVDGALPDVDSAERHGIRYVHIPLGYEGISDAKAAALVKIAETLPGGIYVHCHHGRHRGPAAAAIICQAVENWSPYVAVRWLNAAGTSTDYPGLYRSVLEFKHPSDEDLASLPEDFPSRVEASGLVEVMVQIGARFEEIKKLQEAGFRTNPSHPDLSAVSESLALWELFREAVRTDLGAEHGEWFAIQLGRAGQLAGQLHVCLRELPSREDRSRLREARSAFEALNRECAACHRAYRD